MRGRGLGTFFRAFESSDLNTRDIRRMPDRLAQSQHVRQKQLSKWRIGDLNP